MTRAYKQSRHRFSLPLYCSVPGMQVNVVNSYAAASENVPVSLVRSVDLPTDGKPINPTRVSPACVVPTHNPLTQCKTRQIYMKHTLETSKPSPAPPPPAPCGEKHNKTKQRKHNHNFTAVVWYHTAAHRLRTLDGATNSLFNFANLAFNRPMCFAVALFFCVRFICARKKNGHFHCHTTPQQARQPFQPIKFTEFHTKPHLCLDFRDFLHRAHGWKWLCGRAVNLSEGAISLVTLLTSSLMFQPLPSVRHRAGLAFASVTAQQLQWRVLSLELPRMFSAVTDKESELAKNGRCDVYCVVSGATRQRCRQATSVFIHAMPWNNSTSSAHAITRRHASNSSHQGHGCHGHSSLEQKRRERRQQASKPPATSPLSDHPYAKKQIGSSEPPPQPPLSKKFWTVKDSSQNSPTVEATGTASSTSGVNPLPSSTTRTVYYAFMGNTAILLLKGLMWMRSGSTAMMAETLHTFVDTLNQALLILGVRQSAIAPDRVHQYGYGRAAFFWGLVSALGLFWCGAGVTIFHGVCICVRMHACLC